VKKMVLHYSVPLLVLLPLRNIICVFDKARGNVWL